MRTKKSLQRHQKQGCPRRGEKSDKPPRRERRTKKQLALELAETEPTGYASDDDVSTFEAAAAPPSQQPPGYTPPYIVPAPPQTSAVGFPPYVFQL